MRSPPPIRRAFRLTESITLYRAIGRRPSAVFVDDDRRATADESGHHRLWDFVFEEYVAQPGDQIQDRQGSIQLLTGDGECHLVQLTQPRARSLETAFSHASRTLSADWEIIERMLGDGQLVPVTGRRATHVPFDAAAVKYGEDQPLVRGEEDPARQASSSSSA